MPFVSITNYNGITGVLTYTVSSSESTVLVEKSTDGGTTWNTGLGMPWGTPWPITGLFVAFGTQFRLRLYDGTLSNVWSYDAPAPVEITRTVISSESQITFCNSPVHCRIQNSNADDTIRYILLRLWIWNGDQNKVLGDPTIVYKKDIISLGDDYISLDISNVLKSYIEQPTLTSQSNQPGFGYNLNELPAVSGQGVFWQIQAEVTSVAGTETIDYPTNFATLGWLWNYEQNGEVNPITKHGSLGFPMPIVKWFNPNIPKYFTQDFVLNQDIDECTSSNMISMEVEAKTKTRCTRDSALIVYLDKRGLWDVFTPHGKIIVPNKPKSEYYDRVFRDPSKVNNTIAHSRSRNSLQIDQSYIINTGVIDESDVQRVEELLYSPKVYLIRFAGSVVTEITEGVTIDSTFVTIDDTEITIDSTPIVPTMVPYFDKFQQIPVTVEDQEFNRKTLINDKNSIDYTIKLNETNNKINDIR